MDHAMEHKEEQLAEIEPRGEKTPAEELAYLNAWLRKQGLYASVDFEGRNGERSFSVSIRDRAWQGAGAVSTEAEGRLTSLAEAIVDNEMEGDWADGPGGDGSVEIAGRAGAYLDAVGHNNDWLYEREVDEADLEDADWPGAEDGLEPTPE